MVKRIRALDRGLAALELLERRGPQTLSELARACSLSKATALRLMVTLQDRKWVYRHMNDRRYSLTRTWATEPSPRLLAPHVAMAAASFLRPLTEDTGLAVDLTLVIAPGTLEVIESTRSRHFGRVDPTVIGFRPSIVFSSPGRALLASVGATERKQHLEAVYRSDAPAEKFFVSSGALERELGATRERGYAVRASGYWPASSDFGEEPMDIAVFFEDSADLRICVSLVWPRQIHAPEAVASKHLTRLRACAESIAREVDGTR